MQSALFDFSALVVVILLFICLTTHLRNMRPTIFDDPMVADERQQGQLSKPTHSGLKGLCWKASRIGERLSPYVGSLCVLMAFHLIFIKA